jgi:hypothetical protein
MLKRRNLTKRSVQTLSLTCPKWTQRLWGQCRQDFNGSPTRSGGWLAETRKLLHCTMLSRAEVPPPVPHWLGTMGSMFSLTSPTFPIGLFKICLPWDWSDSRGGLKVASSFLCGGKVSLRYVPESTFPPSMVIYPSLSTLIGWPPPAHASWYTSEMPCLKMDPQWLHCQANAKMKAERQRRRTLPKWRTWLWEQSRRLWVLHGGNLGDCLRLKNVCVNNTFLSTKWKLGIFIQLVIRQEWVRHVIFCNKNLDCPVVPKTMKPMYF